MTEYEPRKELIEKTLPVQLTNEELLECGDRAGHEAAKRTDLEAKFDAVKKDYKAQIDQCSAAVDRLLNQVRTKRKYVTVDVSRIWDVKRNTVIEIRDDTGDLVSERAMTRAEVNHERELLQEKLFDESPESDQGRVIVFLRDQDTFMLPVPEIAKGLDMPEDVCQTLCHKMSDAGLLVGESHDEGRGKNKRTVYLYALAAGTEE